MLAWRNAELAGGFDLTALWAVDSAISEDMLMVLGLILRVHKYPEAINKTYSLDFKQIVGTWCGGDGASIRRAVGLQKS